VFELIRDRVDALDANDSHLD